MREINRGGIDHRYHHRQPGPRRCLSRTPLAPYDPQANAANVLTTLAMILPFVLGVAWLLRVI